jgi:ligand-binding sensor domain-containing protein
LERGEVLLDVLRTPDGTLFFSTWFGKVLELRDGRLALRAKMTGQSRCLARRGDVVWAVADDGMAAVRPDGTTEYLPLTEHPVQKGITAFVDREGSLWVGHGRGAFQFPEPDTVAWSLADGLPTANMRLARTGEGLWITYWGGGLGIIRTTESGHRAARVPQWSELPACVTRAGTLWGAGRPRREAESRIMSRGADGAFRFYGPAVDVACRETSDGDVWITTSEGIHHVSAADDLRHLGRPRGVPGTDLNFASGIDRTLWLIAPGPSLCSALAADVLGGRDPVWVCRAIPLHDVVHNAVVTPSGAVWLATRRSGVLRYDGRSFDTVLGSRELPSQQVHVMEPARDSGIWVSGPQYLWRWHLGVRATVPLAGARADRPGGRLERRGASGRVPRRHVRRGLRRPRGRGRHALGDHLRRCRRSGRPPPQVSSRSPRRRAPRARRLRGSRWCART